MRTYVTLFTLSFLVALVLTPFVRRKALAWGAVAHPDKGRHIHPRPTARLGGVAIYLAFLATLLCVPFLGNMVGDIFRANIPKLSALLLPATIIFLFGVYDDFRGASATCIFCPGHEPEAFGIEEPLPETYVEQILLNKLSG